MTDDGGGFAVGELDSVAHRLIGAGDAVHGTSHALPDVPDAGVSSATVAGALAAIAGASAAIIRCAGAASVRVAAAGAAYRADEESHVARFGGRS
jgi:hypothetical protein